jgi:hypothetical protein
MKIGFCYGFDVFIIVLLFIWKEFMFFFTLLDMTLYELLKKYQMYQLLVGSVVMDVEFGRKDHSSIPITATGEGWNHLISELTPEPD